MKLQEILFQQRDTRLMMPKLNSLEEDICFDALNLLRLEGENLMLWSLLNYCVRQKCVAKYFFYKYGVYFYALYRAQCNICILLFFIQRVPEFNLVHFI